MHYFGGKQRISTELAALINKIAKYYPIYIEPFVGSAAILCKINHRRRIASDANVALINMWRALSSGWVPPDQCTKELYLSIKAAADITNPLTAFVGIGCSYSGKWFGGFAKDSSGRNYCSNAKNSVMKKLNGLHGVTWLVGEYDSISYRGNAFVYCDPPYSGTTGYTAVGTFDSDKFWEFVRCLTRLNKMVLVSEYLAPQDFCVLHEIPTKLDIRSRGGVKEHRIERVFVHKDKLDEAIYLWKL